ncbi:MAG: DUF5684 domain-containing protein, partial [Micrococcales bacterium]|nr:DUF5684 domain-containing protein [Micrococcales bacterium]
MITGSVVGSVVSASLVAGSDAAAAAATTTLVLNIAGAVIAVLVYCWYAAALAGVFHKMGAPKWKAWVPVISQAEVFARAGRPAWWVVLLLVPVVNIVGFVLWIMAVHKINKAFGRGAGYTILALVLSPVWASMLGWGSDHPDLEPERMVTGATGTAAQGPLANPDMVPLWGGAPMAATAPVTQTQPWAPADQVGTVALEDQPLAGQAVAYDPPPNAYSYPVPLGQPVPGQPDPFAQPVPGQPGQPGQPLPGQPLPGQPLPGQPGQMPGQPIPSAAGSLGQPFPGQPGYPAPPGVPGAAPFPGQVDPSVPTGMPGQPFAPGQPLPGQPLPGQPGVPVPGQPNPFGLPGASVPGAEPFGQPLPGQPLPGQPLPGAGQPFGQPVPPAPGVPVAGQLDSFGQPVPPAPG